jgi:ABC-2 type transport system ATP-binding protein
MNPPVIEMRDVVYRYGRAEALHGLNLSVGRGRCHGLFGRNGAGKTTAIKCLLNLLRPASGSVHVFGLSPRRHETAIKARVAYVPDFVAFYPWMTVREALEYQASFRERWNRETESELLKKFELDAQALTTSLSKGQRTQLALIGAICAEPDLLVLDEPTSGLDPLVRREFIQTVIGAFQDAAPGERTVLVSTHLISEFEGLIDRFTVIEQGRALLTADADEARAKFQRLRARFEGEAPPASAFAEARSVRREGRTIELLVNGEGDRLQARLEELRPASLEREALTLEEIFLAAVRSERCL